MTENNVKLLWDCAAALDSDSHASKLLKSYYVNTCRKISGNAAQMPKIKFGAAQMCPRCSLFWSENEFQLKSIPTKIKKNNKTNKLVSYLEKEKDEQTKGLLTKKQRKRAKWLKKKMESQIQIRCEFCQHKSFVKLQKPAAKSKCTTAELAATAEPQKVDTTQALQLDPTEQLLRKSKKKKKRKDKTAGLRIDKKSQVPSTATESTTTWKPTHPTNQPSTLPTQNVSVKTSKKQSAPIQLPTKHEGTVAQPTNIKQKTSAPIKTVPKLSTSAALSQAIKVKKKKKQKKQTNTIQQNKTAANKTTKNQSLTQQKNALLQLASLLKKQGNKSTTNTAQSRLDALLK